ncbi:MAG: GNAT family N-acetyltransferase [Cyclonatronaceae bacterium]
MNIRTYSPADFNAVLNIMVRSHHLDNITEAILMEKIDGDPAFNRDMTLVAETSGIAAGFMQGVLRDVRGEKIAYIKLMGVLPEFRRNGLARGMYEKLEELAVKEGADCMRIYDVVMNYLMPGIDPRYTPALCFAERMGFSRFTDTSNLHARLDRNWNTEAAEKKLENEGITISRAGEDNRKSLMDFIDTHFNLWRHEVSVALANEPASIHVAVQNNIVKAFSAHSANNTGTGWFGPMGTHPDLRGKGVGSILLKRCLDDLKKAGHAYAIIPWVGPISFYSHFCDAVVERVFWRYEKKLSKK